jgi:hypothetical protein
MVYVFFIIFLIKFLTPHAVRRFVSGNLKRQKNNMSGFLQALSKPHAAVPAVLPMTVLLFCIKRLQIRPKPQPPEYHLPYFLEGQIQWHQPQQAKITLNSNASFKHKKHLASQG